MFDPQRLLGGLISEALGNQFGTRSHRKRKYGSGGFGVSKAKIGVGLLGVAIAAYEHFSKSNPQTGNQPGHPGAVPPPPPPPPLGQVPAQKLDQSKSLALIDAMISAANADGAIDAEERRKITERLSTGGAGPDEREYLLNAFLQPKTLGELGVAGKNLQIAREMYAVSLLVLEVDTEAERQYLQMLKKELGLSEADAQEMHAYLGGGQ